MLPLHTLQNAGHPGEKSAFGALVFLHIVVRTKTFAKFGGEEENNSTSLYPHIDYAHYTYLHFMFKLVAPVFSATFLSMFLVCVR